MTQRSNSQRTNSLSNLKGSPRKKYSLKIKNFASIFGASRKNVKEVFNENANDNEELKSPKKIGHRRSRSNSRSNSRNSSPSKIPKNIGHRRSRSSSKSNSRSGSPVPKKYKKKRVTPRIFEEIRNDTIEEMEQDIKEKIKEKNDMYKNMPLSPNNPLSPTKVLSKYTSEILTILQDKCTAGDKKIKTLEEELKEINKECNDSVENTKKDQLEDNIKFIFNLFKTIEYQMILLDHYVNKVKKLSIDLKQDNDEFIEDHIKNLEKISNKHILNIKQYSQKNEKFKKRININNLEKCLLNDKIEEKQEVIEELIPKTIEINEIS